MLLATSSFPIFFRRKARDVGRRSPQAPRMMPGPSPPSCFWRRAISARPPKLQSLTQPFATGPVSRYALGLRRPPPRYPGHRRRLVRYAMSLDWSPASVVDGVLLRGEHDNYLGHCYNTCKSDSPVDTYTVSGPAMCGI